MLSYEAWTLLPFALQGAIGACDECEFTCDYIELCDEHDAEVRDAVQS